MHIKLGLFCISVWVVLKFMWAVLDDQNVPIGAVLDLSHSPFLTFS